MTRPCWLRRAARNRHRHAIEQASRRWRGGRRDDSARTRRKILISTQVVLNTGIDYAPMDSDIVRFRSRGRAGGKHRSLVRTAATPSEGQYDLPPLSRVTLERIDEAGSWTEFGRTPNRRLYTVVVEFLA